MARVPAVRTVRSGRLVPVTVVARCWSLPCHPLPQHGELIGEERVLGHVRVPLALECDAEPELLGPAGPLRLPVLDQATIDVLAHVRGIGRGDRERESGRRAGRRTPRRT